MITSSEVYWIMQMDSIKSGVTIPALLFGVIALVAIIVGLVLIIDPDDVGCKKQGLWMTLVSPFILCLCLLTSLIPSTKTLATMYALPAIVNNETVQTECKELYSIAKSALKDLSDSKEEVKLTK